LVNKGLLVPVFCSVTTQPPVTTFPDKQRFYKGDPARADLLHIDKNYQDAKDLGRNTMKYSLLPMAQYLQL
jgi:hypothetical protein